MKDIRGYEGLYGITMSGRVWSYRSKKFLKPFNDHNGYLQIALYKNNKRKAYSLHRLVAETYIPNPDNKPQVGHIDDDKTNNCWDNLYWTTALNNINYGKRAKCCSGAKKVICLETGKIFRTINEAANEMKISSGNISNVCRGKRKTASDFHFKFVGGYDN